MIKPDVLYFFTGTSLTPREHLESIGASISRAQKRKENKRKREAKKQETAERKEKKQKVQSKLNFKKQNKN